MAEENKTAIFVLSEINRLKIIQDVIGRHLSPTQAAELLGITARHMSRLLKRYRDLGPLGMSNRSRGKPSNRKFPTHFICNVLNIIRENYIDFGPSLIREKLEEIHGIVLGKETVRRIMIQDSLWVPKKKKITKIQQPRTLRSCVGEVVQIDGCYHHWFENRGPACTALVYIDDASSRMMQLCFVKSESTFSYFEATHAYIKIHGKPLAFYSDKLSVFRVNSRSVNTNTQFQRAMDDLNINFICAETAPAKGRVERAHKTLQDRLVKELRLRGINTMNAANAFAKEYMEDYNQRFAKAPRLSHNVHRPLDSSDDLDSIFTCRTTRTVSKSLTFQYKKILYLIKDTVVSRRAIGKDIEIWHYPDGREEIRMNGISLSYTTYLNGQRVYTRSIVRSENHLELISRIASIVEKSKAFHNNSFVMYKEHSPMKVGIPKQKIPFLAMRSYSLCDALVRADPYLFGRLYENIKF